MIEKGRKSTGLIEKQGSGIRRIVEYFAEAQLPPPEFRNISDGFRPTVFASKEANDPLNVLLKDRQKRLLKLIKDNKFITADELAAICAVSGKTIKRDLDFLKNKNMLKRMGSKKSGYWELTI